MILREPYHLEGTLTGRVTSMTTWNEEVVEDSKRIFSLFAFRLGSFEIFINFLLLQVDYKVQIDWITSAAYALAAAASSKVSKDLLSRT